MRTYLPGKLLILLVLAGVVLFSCKKIELERIPFVVTSTPQNINDTYFDAYGIISDIGDGNVGEYGFCYSSTKNIPVIEDNINCKTKPVGSVASTGGFDSRISSLSSNTTYYIRAYMEYGSGVVYGSVLNFKTAGGTPTPNPRWFDYYLTDAVTGIGRTNGGNFDATIRIPAADIAQFTGFRVAKVGFYAWDPDPAITYYITTWEGGLTGTVLKEYQQITGVTSYAWNEFSFTTNIPVNTGLDLWFGVWIVDQPQGIFPVGADSGPVMEPFYSDVYSVDDGTTWISMSQEYGIDRNWNIKGYVTNLKGEEYELGSTGIRPVNRPVFVHGMPINPQVTESNNINRNK
ncbi:MAG: hypothetical protein KKA81_15600 [Bacteroidetes bacterium]|nr:hypothetical protein [Bacteroidota bacterium]